MGKFLAASSLLAGMRGEYDVKIGVEPAAREYIKARSQDNSITLEVVERPGGV